MHQEPSGVWIMAYTTIDKPSDYFNTVLYSGTGSSQAITGVGFQPDWVWIKNRTGTNWHTLYDVIRGTTKVLNSNQSEAESTDATGLTSFDSDGFTHGSGGNGNVNGGSFVSWNWLASNTTASNSNGSITSSVSASTTAGFSIVSYTGNATSGATVGHGLSSQLDVIFIKNRTDAEAWQTYHRPLGATHHLSLNATSSAQDNDTRFNDTDPTSSVFTLGNNDTVNKNSSNFIAYCFAEVKGFSKFGSYTGNGNADGTFVYTGFKPAFIIFKRTSGTGNWQLLDNKRTGFNPENHTQYPNSNLADQDETDANIFSNGFKLTNTGTDGNGSGSTYIYMAFAEAPFVTAGTKAAGTAR
jgi:hypothetical protein